MKFQTPHAVIVATAGYAGKIGGGSVTDLNDVLNLANGQCIVATDRGTILTASPSDAELKDVKSIVIRRGFGNPEKATQRTPRISRLAVKSFQKFAYQAPLRKVDVIGYNGSGGSMNLPILVEGSAGEIRFENKLIGGPIMIENLDYADTTYQIGDTNYTFLMRLVRTINQKNTSGAFRARAFLMSNATINAAATVTGTGAMVVTKDSNVVTVNSHNVVAGAYLVFGVDNQTGLVSGTPTLANHDLYRVVSVDTNSFVLDRPYGGETQSIAEADYEAGGRVRTATPVVTPDYGIKFIGELGKNYTIAAGNVLLNATRTSVTAHTPGQGTPALVQADVLDTAPYEGFNQPKNAEFPQIDQRADLSTNYDALSIIGDASSSYATDTVPLSEPFNFLIYVPTGTVHPLETILEKAFGLTGAAGVEVEAEQ